RDFHVTGVQTCALPIYVGWNELHTTDWQAAFAFYSGLFGWQKDQAMDMEPMGTYQLFSVDGGDAVGGMMTNPDVPGPFWLHYIKIGRAACRASAWLEQQ